MKLSFKQKTILYISIVCFIITALYTNIFFKERIDLDTQVFKNKVEIYE